MPAYPTGGADQVHVRAAVDRPVRSAGWLRGWGARSGGVVRVARRARGAMGNAKLSPLTGPVGCERRARTGAGQSRRRINRPGGALTGASTRSGLPAVPCGRPFQPGSPGRLAAWPDVWPDGRSGLSSWPSWRLAGRLGGRSRPVGSVGSAWGGWIHGTTLGTTRPGRNSGMHKSGEPIQTYLTAATRPPSDGMCGQAARLTSSAKARRAQRTVQDVGARKARMTAPQMPPARGRMTVPQKAAAASRKLVRRWAQGVDGGAEFADALFEGAHGLRGFLVLGGPRAQRAELLLHRRQASLEFGGELA